VVYFILLLILYFPIALQAQEDQVFIIGAGQASCGKWIESKNTHSLRHQGKEWVLGFISGYNWGKDEKQVMPTDGPAVIAFIDRYCKNNPLKPILYGAMELVQELYSNKSTQSRRK